MLNPDRLYELLPVYYRQRDLEAGEPLRALLQVVSEQVTVVEQDIAALYENLFIETCDDWVVPYIADLIGYRLAADAGAPANVLTPQGQQRNRRLIPRRDVANTIRYRRRKGTLALLEQLAVDIAGWPARAVEFGRLVSGTQSLHHLRADRGRLANLHSGDALDRLQSPFDILPHTVDVRRINSNRRRGRYGASAVGLFVFRVKSYSVTRSQARCMEEGDEAGDHCFTFSPLGNDTPLYNAVTPDPDQSRFSGELNLPTPIRRRAFEERPAGLDHAIASAAYYGEGKSVALWLGANAKAPVPRDRVIPADLSEWAYRPPAGYVAVDPVRGRLCFRPGDVPASVTVSYSYGFGGDLGGGNYHREEPASRNERIYAVSADRETGGRLRKTLERWKADHPDRAVIEILDSQTYDEDRLIIEIAAGQVLEIRAAPQCRPVIRMVDAESGRAEAISIDIKGGGKCVFTGLLITGRGVRIKGDDGEVVFRHCTLVPGWGLHNDCKPHHAGDPSILLRESRARLTIEHSILGGIQIQQPRRDSDPTRIHISDSILDSTSSQRLALWDEDSVAAWARLTIVRSTVLGQIQVHALELAENTIFSGTVTAARRQSGCVRFCYLPSGSRTPRRFRCQPDLVSAGLTGDDKIAAESTAVPMFKSTRYGTPAYGQLADGGSDVIRRGGDDEAEMGAFHDLFQPQRLAALRARLEEYVPANSEVGILLSS